MYFLQSFGFNLKISLEIISPFKMRTVDNNLIPTTSYPTQRVVQQIIARILIGSQQIVGTLPLSGKNKVYATVGGKQCLASIKQHFPTCYYFAFSYTGK